MSDIVEATSVSRHGIYTTFGGKKALFLACFDRYQETVVSPAFRVVEEKDAGLESIATYFEYQISRGETIGLPGPGCFVANSATEVAPKDADVLAKVTHHNERLRTGFRNAFLNENPAAHPKMAGELADVTVTFTNGLWTQTRTVTDAHAVRRAVSRFLAMISETLR